MRARLSRAAYERVSEVTARMKTHGEVACAERKVVAEVTTPGCWGTLPAASHPARFAMLCGDGKIATVTLDDKGQVADRQASEKVFDAVARPRRQDLTR